MLDQAFYETSSKTIIVRANHPNWELIRALAVDPEEHSRWSYARRLARDIAFVLLVPKKHNDRDMQAVEWRLRHLHKRVTQVKL